MADPVLSIRGLTVYFPTVIAVRDLSLDLNPGEVCGLIGPNGSGKTTIMRVAVGLQKPTLGLVRVSGLDPWAEPTTCKGVIGFMPDTAPLYAKLKVEEFLDHFARAYSVPDRGRRVVECLELTWLTTKASSLCGELSRGMKQRLILAKALLHDPPLLVLDEPASGIDPIGRIELRKVLVGLRERGKAILVSSHILTEMDQFCNTVAIMERGRLVKSGPIAELARATGRRRMSLRWRQGGTPVVQDVLGGCERIEATDMLNHSARFVFTGDDETLDGLLAELVRRDVGITEWRCLDDHLEQILIETGAREVM